MSFDCGGSQSTQREHANSMARNQSQEPCCEATVLITAPPSRPQQLFIPIKKKKLKKNEEGYITCLALRPARLYLADRECPASTQMFSILRILWWIHLYWILFSKTGSRPFRLSRTTACSDSAWKYKEKTKLVLYYLRFWTESLLSYSFTAVFLK